MAKRLESFKVNIQKSKTETISIENPWINENIEVKQLKHLIRFNQNMKDNVKFDLVYNNIKMNDEYRLKKYNIIDSKHLIKMIIKVDKSESYSLNNIKQIKKDNIYVATQKQIESITNMKKLVNVHKKSISFLDNFETS